MKTTCYVVVDPRGVSRITKNPPGLEADELSIQLTLTIPDQFFRRPILTASVVIPEDLLASPSFEFVIDDTAMRIAKDLKLDAAAVRDGLQFAVDRSKEERGTA